MHKTNDPLPPSLNAFSFPFNFSTTCAKNKPILRYGDEHKLAGFSATLQAIISFVENSGDHIKFVRAAKHQVMWASCPKLVYFYAAFEDKSKHN
jgi:hypothetical protein